METKQGNLEFLPDSVLIHVNGGGGDPKGTKDFSQEQKNLIGAGAAGALAGLVEGAPGGPPGMAAGALGGFAVGVGAYMTNSYITGGDKSKIPSVSDMYSNRPSWADFRRMDNR